MPGIDGGLSAMAIAGMAAQAASAASSNNNQQKQQAAIAQAAQAQALQQQQFLNANAVLGNQRSTAGYTDSEGNSYSYDPATNSWRQQLGALPQQVQRASEMASVTRNTTDQAQQALANEISMRNAAAAQPAAQSALTSIANYKPINAAGLTGRLVNQTVNAQNETNQPLLDALTTQAARQGSAMGPQLAEVQRQQAQNTRDAITNAVIQGSTNTGAVNTANLQPLVAKYGALSGAATPTLNYQGIDNQNPNAALTGAVTQRAASAGTAPYMGMQGMASSMYGVNQATDSAIKAVPNSNQLSNQLSGLGGILSNMGNLSSTSPLYKTLSGAFSSGGGGKGGGGMGTTLLSGNSPAFGAQGARQ
jgi:hypothetical protein